jgi:phage tail sheath protein FI
VRAELPGTPVFQRAGLAPEELATAIAESGWLVAAPTGGRLAARGGGPAARTWRLDLGGGADPVVGAGDYVRAVIEQAQIDEIALVCAPGLEQQVGSDEGAGVLAALAAAAATGQDRLVVAATAAATADALGAWRERLARAIPDPAHRRAVAVYAPWLVAEDLARAGADPYVPTDPAGHVCGIAAQLDRERGSGWSPANALVNDAIDVEVAPDEAFAYANQVNVLRGRIGGGLELWGAHTLDAGDGRHIAHRRLVHRLVRAIRRVAEPLVFDVNGPELWFTVVRAISGVLLEAFRSGALLGDTPAQAYRVRCDAQTNPPDALAEGLAVCEIELAVAAPMEFITLRLTLGAQGLLEVVEQ